MNGQVRASSNVTDRPESGVHKVEMPAELGSDPLGLLKLYLKKRLLSVEAPEPAKKERDVISDSGLHHRCSLERIVLKAEIG